METYDFEFEDRTGIVHWVEYGVLEERYLYGADADGRRGKVSTDVDIDWKEVTCDGLALDCLPVELRDLVSVAVENDFDKRY